MLLRRYKYPLALILIMLSSSSTTLFGASTKKIFIKNAVTNEDIDTVWITGVSSNCFQAEDLRKSDQLANLLFKKGIVHSRDAVSKKTQNHQQHLIKFYTMRGYNFLAKAYGSTIIGEDKKITNQFVAIRPPHYLILHEGEEEKLFARKIDENHVNKPLELQPYTFDLLKDDLDHYEKNLSKNIYYRLHGLFPILLTEIIFNLHGWPHNKPFIHLYKDTKTKITLSKQTDRSIKHEIECTMPTQKNYQDFKVRDIIKPIRDALLEKKIISKEQNVYFFDNNNHVIEEKKEVYRLNTLVYLPGVTRASLVLDESHRHRLGLLGKELDANGDSNDNIQELFNEIKQKTEDYLQKFGKNYKDQTLLVGFSKEPKELYQLSIAFLKESIDNGTLSTKRIMIFPKKVSKVINEESIEKDKGYATYVPITLRISDGSRYQEKVKWLPKSKPFNSLEDKKKYILGVDNTSENTGWQLYSRKDGNPVTDRTAISEATTYFYTTNRDIKWPTPEEYPTDVYVYDRPKELNLFELPTSSSTGKEMIRCKASFIYRGKIFHEEVAHFLIGHLGKDMKKTFLERIKKQKTTYKEVDYIEVKLDKKLPIGKEQYEIFLDSFAMKTLGELSLDKDFQDIRFHMKATEWQAKAVDVSITIASLVGLYACSKFVGSNNFQKFVDRLVKHSPSRRTQRKRKKLS